MPSPGTGATRAGGGAAATVVAAAVLLALAVGLVVVLHSRVPDVHGLGSLVETFLPWSGVVVLLLAVAAVVRRSWVLGVAVAFAGGAWLWTCWPLVAPAPDGRGDLVVVQHNVADTNTDPVGTAAVLLAADPDVVTLVEVTPELDAALTAALADRLPHHAVRGTVGVWSRYPLSDVAGVDIRPADVADSWERGLRVVVDRPDGVDPAVYAVHAPSVRLVPRGGFTSGTRDESLRLLGEVLAADPAPVVVVGGDLNATLLDRGLDPVLAEVATPAGTLGLTYPAALPLVRIDHVLARGAEVTGVATLGRTGSDHLPVVAEVTLDP